MIKKRMPLLFATLLLLSFSPIYSEMLFYDNPVVLKISFEGLINTDLDDIEDLVTLSEGDILDEDELNSTLKTLYGLNRFSDAKVDIEDLGEGLVVTFFLEENPIIGEITIDGNETMRRSELEDSILISEGDFLSLEDISDTLKAMQTTYEEDGYVDIDVDYELTEVTNATNTFDVAINISEGDKIVVEEINITGAENLEVSKIKGVMETKEKVFLLQNGVLDEEVFLTDMSTIELLYHQQGYLDMSFNEYKWEIETVDEDKKEHLAIVVYIDIDEGEQYFVGDITLTNNTIFTDEELMEFIDLAKGDVYDSVTMEYGKYYIYNEYSDIGHLYANVSVLETKDTNSHTVDAEVVIYEGPRAHIESITITGNEKTQTNVIERELLFEEGELYVQTKVRESYEYLIFTQYFSDVEFTPGPGSAEGLINLEIDVEEQRTGLFTAGIGYGTESKFNATASISEQNLFGSGRSLTFAGEYGQTSKSLELTFQEPWLFDTPTTAAVSASIGQYNYEDIPTDDDGDLVIDGTNVNYITDSTTSLPYYESTNEYYRFSIGLGASVSRRFWINWNAFASYAFNMYKDYGENFTTPLIYVTNWQTNTNLMQSLSNGNEGYTIKHTVGLGVSVDTSDSPINPTHGVAGSAYAYYVGGIFGGSINYIKPKLSLNYYVPVWELVLAFHTSAEALMPQFDGAHDYDSSDMLYFDGVYEMRGWQYLADRGESKWFNSAELRFPLYQDYLWGLSFFDIGNLWGDYNGFTFDPEGYMASFGIGIKINIPQLPIRLYLARKAEYDSDLSKWQLSTDQYFFKNWEIVFSIQGLF